LKEHARDRRSRAGASRRDRDDDAARLDRAVGRARAAKRLLDITAREADLTSRLQADLEYISGWTIWRDIRILFATSMVLLHDRAF